MRINVVCEVITYASLLQAWRGLGGPPTVGVRCVGSSNSWRFHQQHHELEFWRDESIEKAIGGEADIPKHPGLFIVTASSPLG